MPQMTEEEVAQIMNLISTSAYLFFTAAQLAEVLIRLGYQVPAVQQLKQMKTTIENLEDLDGKQKK